MAELALGDRLAAIDRHLYGVGLPPVELDVSVYTDPVRHAAELAAMRRAPQVAVPAADVAEPGQFVTLDLLGTPLIVARVGAGVHAMVNACAHRGATVRHEPCGAARLHACRFHGWSYELDGTLRSVAEPDRFGGRPDVPGLRRVACAERHGLVWVALDAPAADALDVAGWLGPDLDALFGALGLGAMLAHRSAAYDLACNWKMVTDGFLETYHIKYLHRDSVAPYVPSNRAMVDRCAQHFLAYLPKNRLLRQLAEAPRDEWRVLDHLTMTATLVPATIVQWNAGHVELFAVRPHLTDPGRCTVVMTLLVPSDRSGEADLWDRNWERLAATIPAEDFATAEEVQANIAAGAVTRLQIGATERALAEHLAAVDRTIHD